MGRGHGDIEVISAANGTIKQVLAKRAKIISRKATLRERIVFSYIRVSE
jgi:hypothetical protein